jgi:hypothetical protein
MWSRESTATEHPVIGNRRPLGVELESRWPQSGGLLRADEGSERGDPEDYDG